MGRLCQNEAKAPSFKRCSPVDDHTMRLEWGNVMSYEDGPLIGYRIIAYIEGGLTTEAWVSPLVLPATTTTHTIPVVPFESSAGQGRLEYYGSAGSPTVASSSTQRKGSGVGEGAHPLRESTLYRVVQCVYR